MRIKRLVILIIGLLFTHATLYAQLTEQQQIQKLNYAYQYIRQHYVDDVPLGPLVEEAIIATLKELDPHSQYLTREQMESAKSRLKGEFAGVGIRYIIHNDTLVVRTITPGSPAQKAGIRPNDRITAVDNKSIVGLTADSISTLLRGDVNTKVELQLTRRDGRRYHNIKLRREFIETSAVSAAFRVDSVGYVALSTFSKPAASEFYSSLKSLGDINSVIVDLRDNGGGAITSAIDLTSLFLNKGDVIVSTEGRNNNATYNTSKDGELSSIPVIVLINENSASASEIFAGAIQDHDRGVIMGHTSFGKGLVQRLVSLKDGTGMTVTVARYKTPSGRIIQRPYSMGNGEAYACDRERYKHPDSIAHNDKLLFNTLKSGRTVYGGGGITPDVYIDTDSIRLSYEVAKAVQEGKFEHSVVDMWDRVSIEAIEKEYPTVEEFFNNYKLDAKLLDLFGKYIKTDIDRCYVETLLMATIAEQLYGSFAKYFVYGLCFDYMLQQALMLAKDRARQYEILH